MSDSDAVRQRFSNAELVHIAVCAALMAICSWISVPAIPPLPPFTMQTFAVFFILLLFGGRCGFYAVLTYVLLGAVGLPVFAHFSGGVGILLGTTGGYIVGFVFTAALYWWLEHFIDDKPAQKIAALVLGLVVCFAFGTAWFMLVYARQSGAVGLGAALSWCVAPYIIPDALKLALAYGLSEAMKAHQSATLNQPPRAL